MAYNTEIRVLHTKCTVESVALIIEIAFGAIYMIAGCQHIFCQCDIACAAALLMISLIVLIGSICI